MSAFNKYVTAIAGIYILIIINETIISLYENKYTPFQPIEYLLKYRIHLQLSICMRSLYGSAIGINSFLAASMFFYQFIFPYHQTCFRIHAWGSIVLVKHLTPQVILTFSKN